MNSVAFRWMTRLIVVFILIFVGFQVYKMAYRPYATEVVFEYTVADSIAVQGVMIRDEKVIDIDKVGTTKYFSENGSKVAKNSTIAKIFTDDAELLTSELIQELQAEIELLEASQNPGSIVAVLPEALTKQINDTNIALVKSIENGQLEKVDELRNQYLALLNKRQIVVGKETDFAQRIDTLKQQKTALESSLVGQNEMIRVSESGYFANMIDGYEETLSSEVLNTLTVDSLSDLIANKKLPEDSTKVGKLITSNLWYFAILIDTKDVNLFKNSTTVDIVFSSTITDPVTAQVEDIISDSKNEKSMVILSGDSMSDVLSTTRFDDAQIQFEKHTGLKIPKSAIRFEDDKKGAYVVIGNQIVFRELAITYETEDFAISAIDWANDDSVKMYDSVIVRGKDIYDKKQIK